MSLFVTRIRSSAVNVTASLQTSALAGATPSPDKLRKMDAWWRAANYLNVGQIYLSANPLL
jgi:phosphoketolase